MMAVDRSPLPSYQHPLAIPTHPSLLTCSAVIPCSSVDFAVYRPLSNSFCIDRSSPNLANCIKSCSTGNLGGLASKSLSSTLSKPSFPGEFDALLEGRRSSGFVDAAREGIAVGALCR